MREAILSAELYERGRRFAAAGRPQEAATWLRAVLDTEPVHREAARLLAEMVPGAEAATPAQTRTDMTGEEATSQRSEAIETETRYARVAFVNLEGAFTARNEEPANEVPFVVEAGITPLKRLMLVGSLESVVSVRSTHEQLEDFTKWGLRGIVNVVGDGFASVFRRGTPTVNLEVGYNDVVAGRNTADAFEVFGKVGVSF